LNASSRASFLKADEEVSGTISKKQIPPLRCGMTTKTTAKTKSKNKKQKQKAKADAGILRCAQNDR
jgi:hypothetical protein